MNWKLILKEDSTPNIISAGAIKTKFSKGNLPSKKEIDEIVEVHGQVQIKNIDTALTQLKSAYNKIAQGEDAPNSIINRMIEGRFSKVGKDREDSLRIVGERLKELQALKGTDENPLINKTIGGITFGELVSPDDKTNQEWTIETLNALYQKMITEPSVELLYALHYFINTSTDGNWSRAGGWVNRMGKDSIENPDTQFLKNVFDLRGKRDVKGNIDKKVFEFFNKGNKFKYTTEGMRNITVKRGKGKFVTREGKEISPSRKYEQEGGFREVTREVGDSRNIVMGERKSMQYLITDDLVNKIKSLTEQQFIELVNNLNKTNSSIDFISSLKGTTTEIVYMLLSRDMGINALVRNIDVARKGMSPSSRRKDYLHDWAVKEVNKRMKNANDSDGEDFELFNIVLPSQTKAEEIIENKGDSYDEFRRNKSKMIDNLKGKVRGGDETWNKSFETWLKSRRRLEDSYQGGDSKTLDPSQNPVNVEGAMNINYSFKTSNQINDFIENLGGDTVFRSHILSRNLLALFFDYYIDFGPEEGRDKGERLRTLGDFKGYLPSGRIFADSTETTFFDSMRALLTVIKKVLTNSALRNYNQNINMSLEKFFEGIDELFKKEGGEIDLQPDDDENRKEIFSDIDAMDSIDDNLKSSWFGTKAYMLNIEDELSFAMMDLKEAVAEKIAENIILIAEDTTDKYRPSGIKIGGRSKGIRDYLALKKFIIPPKPPKQIKVNKTTYKLDESMFDETDLDAQLKYYAFEKEYDFSEEPSLNMDKVKTLTLREAIEGF
tara:strand:+ start:7242 stop:9575 length:2334 start_codon:yes stop_codon:yes gene_type:complete